MNSTPIRPETIILFTALPPAPPMPATMICGLSSRSSGALRLIVIVWPLDVGAPVRTLGFSVTLFAAKSNESPRLLSPHAPLKTILEPSTDPPDVSIRLRLRSHSAPRRAEMLDAAHLRIDQKPDSRGESRAFRGFGQPLDAERPPRPHLPRDDALHRRLHAGELAGTTGENESSPRMRGKARVLEPIAHELEDFLHTRLDDGDELRLRQMGRTFAFLARLNPRDRLVFIETRSEAAAIKRLQPFG